MGLPLVIGGASGSLIDRVQRGYVVDPVDVLIRDYHLPEVDAADGGITAGVGLLRIHQLQTEAGRRRRPVRAHRHHVGADQLP